MNIATRLRDPDRFSKWFLSEQFADIHFVVKGQQKFPGHRIIVATESQLLITLADSEGIIRLMNTDEETLKAALSFIYKSYLDLQSTDEPEISLLTVSKMYAMERLHQSVFLYLRRELTSTSALLWLPHLGEFQELRDRVWNLIDAEADKGLSSGNFAFTSEENVFLLVKRATLDVDEFFLHERICQWATARHEGDTINNAEGAEIRMQRLVKLLRFSQMTTEEFENGPARYLASDELQSVRNWICNGDTKPEWCVGQSRIQRGSEQIAHCHSWNTKYSGGYRKVGVIFTVDKPILLAGIGAITDGPYGVIDVTTTLTAVDVISVKQRSFVDLGSHLHGAYVNFVDLIMIEPDVEYSLQVTLHSKNGNETFRCSNDTFKPLVTYKISKNNLVTFK